MLAVEKVMKTRLFISDEVASLPGQKVELLSAISNFRQSTYIIFSHMSSMV
jgi:hypothetical protein